MNALIQVGNPNFQNTLPKRTDAPAKAGASCGASRSGRDSPANAGPPPTQFAPNVAVLCRIQFFFTLLIVGLLPCATGCSKKTPSLQGLDSNKKARQEDRVRTKKEGQEGALEVVPLEWAAWGFPQTIDRTKAPAEQIDGYLLALSQRSIHKKIGKGDAAIFQYILSDDFLKKRPLDAPEFSKNFARPFSSTLSIFADTEFKDTLIPVARRLLNIEDATTSICAAEFLGKARDKDSAEKIRQLVGKMPKEDEVGRALLFRSLIAMGEPLTEDESALYERVSKERNWKKP